MTTLLLLLAHYNGHETVQFKTIARDIFAMEPEVLLRRLKSGQIDPRGRDPAQLKLHGIPLPWIAAMIEDRRTEAKKRMRDWCGDTVLK
ncbi:MAG: hypothetical protein ACLGIP_00330 [Alphaproteobacteria bacterium]